MRVQIEIAPGELVDRITILEIKLEMIDDPTKLQHIKNEHSILVESVERMRETLIINKQSHKLKDLDRYVIEIREANEKIWNVLQRQRELERAGHFGDEFIRVSLAVYHINDERAVGKRKINELLDTDIAEVKSYPEHRHDQINCDG